LKIPGPEDVGSAWPLQGSQRLVFEDIIDKVQRFLDAAEPRQRDYEGEIKVNMPTNFSMDESEKFVAGTFETKLKGEGWRVATLKSVNKTILRITFEFKLRR